MKTRIYAILSVTLLLVFAACQDDLNEIVYSSLTDETAYTTAENAKAGVTAIYGQLHHLYREPMFNINDIASDDGFKSGSDFEALNDEGIFNANSTQHAWDDLYAIASRASLALDMVSEMDDALFTDTGITKDQLFGEAYFMRAYAYYNLTDIFYQVPLVTSSHVDPAAKLPYANIDKIDDQIEADLLKAKDLLPMGYSDRTDAGRATYGAAAGFLTRLYMRRAGRIRLAGGDATTYWNKALNAVNEVLSLEGSQYALQPHVWDIFDPSREESLYNDEIIFAVRASALHPSGSWDLALQFTSWNYDMGWGNIFQPVQLPWHFEPSDERYSKLQVVEYKDYYRPTEKYYKAPGKVEDVGSVNQNHEVDGVTYTFMEEMGETYTAKYKYEGTGTYIYDTKNNMIILRLADMILCKAEILNEINGPSQESVDLVNRIRERAFQNSDHNLQLADYSGKDGLRRAICEERLLELNLECVRRPDLIRMGLWKECMTRYIDTIRESARYREINEGQAVGFYDGTWAAYPDPATLKDDDARRYLPIPYREVNMNPELASARTGSGE